MFLLAQHGPLGCKWGLSTVGTKSRNSLLNWPGESIEEAFLDTRKQQFSMKCRAQKVVFALFTSQVKENELQFLPYSYFWFLPCSNPNYAPHPCTERMYFTIARLSFAQIWKPDPDVDRGWLDRHRYCPGTLRRRLLLCPRSCLLRARQLDEPLHRWVEWADEAELERLRQSHQRAIGDDFRHHWTDREEPAASYRGFSPWR